MFVRVAPFFPFYFSGAIFCVFLHPSAAECVDYFYESQCPVLEGLDLISIAEKILVYVWQTQGQTTYLQKKSQSKLTSTFAVFQGTQQCRF